MKPPTDPTAAWQKFAPVAVECLAMADHYEEMEEAFYAGMMSMFGMIQDVSGRVISNREKNAITDRWGITLAEIAEYYRRRGCKVHGDHGGTPP